MRFEIEIDEDARPNEDAGRPVRARVMGGPWRPLDLRVSDEICRMASDSMRLQREVWRLREENEAFMRLIAYTNEAMRDAAKEPEQK
jgi:hypothetical protein